MSDNPTTQTFIRRGPVTIDQLRTQPTVSVEQAADLIGVSRTHGYQMLADGLLDGIRVGQRRWRVKSACLLRMLGEDR